MIKLHRHTYAHSKNDVVWIGGQTIPMSVSWFWYHSTVMWNVTIGKNWVKGTQTSLYYICNFLRIHAYFKIESIFKRWWERSLKRMVFSHRSECELPEARILQWRLSPPTPGPGLATPQRLVSPWRRAWLSLGAEGHTDVFRKCSWNGRQWCGERELGKIKNMGPNSSEIRM